METVAAPRKILIVHQSWQPPGGSNAVAAWIAEALKSHYALTLLAWNRVNTAELNRFYGTTLQPTDFTVIYPNRLLRMLFKLDPDPGSLQPTAYLMRVCHKIRRHYDLVMGAAVEEMDLGGPGLLYIHYPELSRFWPKYRDCAGKPLAAKILHLLKGETRPWMILANYSLERLKENAILANSDWTGSLFERIYGVKTRTLYPPVQTPAAERTWSQRPNWFLASGRFNPLKRLDWIVSTLSQVRKTQPDLMLHLAGTRAKVGGGPKHYCELRRLAEANSNWVTLHENLSRQDLCQLTAQVRYGIHAQINEHFGIAPAEVLMGGGIPFVHNSGGQVEISGRDPRLCFTTQEDAVEKITAVMRDHGAQEAILESLAPRKKMFTCERFVEGIREAVRRRLAGCW
jgi:glycosyltransferase involved in cell wall biosynthesis